MSATDKFTLPALPWEKSAIGAVSENLLNFHYDKHHAGYVRKLNALVAGTEQADKSVLELIREASGAIFNCAAQHWNHTFYWRGMAPNAGGNPTGDIAAAIDRDFGSFEAMKEQFDKVAGGHFGSGWAWLAEKDGKLHVVGTHDAGNPITEGYKPLLTCDVWEHAYYLDFQNRRADYIQSWWGVVNWQFVNEQLAAEGPMSL
ncbi:MAG: hypothetical protein MHM6MM_007485 [Cercozoa sp. M6MM]